MKFLIILLAIIFSFGQLTRDFRLNDLAVFVVLVFGLRRVSGPLAVALGLFLLAVIVSLAFNLKNFSLYELLTSSLYPLRFFAYAGLYFVFKNAPHDFTRRWLVLAAVIIAVTGLLQYAFVPDVSFLAAFDWDDHYYRLIGTFLDPGFTGAILVFGLLLVYFSKNSSKFPLMAVIYLALSLTYSRASYLMYLVSFAAISVYKKSLKIFLVASFILLLTLISLPRRFGEGANLSRENSILARLNNWKQTLSVWQKHPLFGVGFNTYRYVVGVAPQSHSGGADSSIFLVLATTGIVGFLAYLNLLLTMWNLGRRNLIFAASFLGILAHSFFNNTLFYPHVLEWLWIILALR